jgi:glycosyltransferase involved in cell wall biosynthesis
MRRRISVVTPCFNEGDNVVDCVMAVRQVFASRLPEYDYEHVFADNASTDDTVERLRRMAAEDKRIKLILNAGNFGPFRSAMNALLAAGGDAVLVFLAADLEDPPDVLVELVRRWEQGWEVVHGLRVHRAEGWWLRVLRRAYYGLTSRVADTPMPPDVGEFQLIDRAVVEALREFDDRHPYLRGMIASCGFRTTGVRYASVPRKKGRTKLRWWHALEHGLNVVSFSSIPLRLCGAIGLAVVAGTSAYALVHGLARLAGLVDADTAVLPLVLTFVGGVQLVFLGVLGESVRAMHAQLRGRPLVVERERVNFDAAPAGGWRWRRTGG